MIFVKIIADARSVHGQFYNGEIRCVTSEVGGELKGKGWAEDAEPELHVAENDEKPDPVTLEIQNSTVGVESPEVGL